MKLIIGSDHAAYEVKEELKKHLSLKHEVVDVGTHSTDSCDYPDYAIELCKAVRKEECLGILLCGSGVGVSMVANRFKGIRASLCLDVLVAGLSRSHNNANVLCLGARLTPMGKIIEISDVWLSTSFEGDRHAKRVEKFDNLGSELPD